MPAPYTLEQFRAAFWSKVQWGPGCMRGDRAAGVGSRHFPGEQVPARIAWLLDRGEFDRSKHILHTCDNAACVNPSHLYVGTHAQNMRDKVERGRSHHPRGAKNGRARLTPEMIVAARGAYGHYGVMSILARRFGVSRTTLRSAATGKTWNDRQVGDSRARRSPPDGAPRLEVLVRRL